MKDTPLECFPNVCTGRPYNCNVLCPCATCKMGNTCHACAHITFTQFAQKGLVGSMFAHYAFTMHVATLKRYLHACSYTIGPDRSIEVIWKTFLLSVLVPSLPTLPTKYICSYTLSRKIQTK